MKVTALKPFGALVGDVNLSARRSAQESADLLQAFNEHYLLVVRGQNFSDEDHLRIFHDLFPGEEPGDESGTGQKVSYVSNVRPDGYFGDGPLTFHSDFSFTTAPTKVISLYGYEVESGSSPTEFASNELALRTIPAELLAYLEDKQVVCATDLMSVDAHLPSYNLPGREDLSGRSHEEIVRAAWPVIMQHPGTGRPLIYVNEQHSHHLRGVPLAEGRDVLQRLFSYLYAPNMIYTHEWQEGDFVLWDNIGISHGRRATAVHQARRTLRRVAAGGATPSKMTQLSQYGIDGSEDVIESPARIAHKQAVGNRIKTLRVARCLTQQGLSEAVNIRYKRIAQFESGNWLPTDREIVQVASFFGVAPEELADVQVRAAEATASVGH